MDEIPHIPPGPIAKSVPCHPLTVVNEGYRQGLKVATDANGRRLYTESQAEQIKAAIVARRNGSKLGG